MIRSNSTRRSARALVCALAAAGLLAPLATTGPAHATPVVDGSAGGNRAAVDDGSDASLGRLLGAQPVTDRAFAFDGTAEVFSLTYLSRGPQGDIIPLRATAWLPSAGAPKTSGHPVLAYTHGTIGVGDSCQLAPTMTQGGPGFGPVLSPWLRRGFLVVAPEYAGNGSPGPHAYLDGRTAAANALDAVRAARQLAQQQGVEVSDEFVTHGASQGGHASLFTATQARRYAPELRLAATSSTAPPVHIDRYLSLLGPQIPSVPVPDYIAYLSFVLRGVAAADPSLDIDSYLTSLGRKIVRQAETLCYQDMVEATEGVGVGQMLSRPLNQGPLMAAVRRIQVVPTTGYDAPVLIQQGVVDVTAFGPLTEIFVHDATTGGADIDYRRLLKGHRILDEGSGIAAGWAAGKLR